MVVMDALSRGTVDILSFPAPARPGIDSLAMLLRMGGTAITAAIIPITIIPAIIQGTGIFFGPSAPLAAAGEGVPGDGLRTARILSQRRITPPMRERTSR